MFFHHEWTLLGINGAVLREDVTFLGILMSSSFRPIGVNLQVRWLPLDQRLQRSLAEWGIHFVDKNKGWARCQVQDLVEISDCKVVALRVGGLLCLLSGLQIGELMIILLFDCDPVARRGRLIWAWSNLNLFAIPWILDRFLLLSYRHGRGLTIQLPPENGI
jgi:hypothetical protein